MVSKSSGSGASYCPGMASGETELEQAERLVREGEWHVAIQREVVLICGYMRNAACQRKRQSRRSRPRKMRLSCIASSWNDLGTDPKPQRHRLPIEAAPKQATVNAGLQTKKPRYGQAPHSGPVLSASGGVTLHSRIRGGP